MTTELTLTQDLNLSQIGATFAKSGYFKDASDATKAIVKIMAGQELGIPPVASMQGIHIIQGAPSMGAGLMAAQVKRSGKYNYRIRELTDDKATIEFFEGKESVGTSIFTAADAKKAGTQNMSKYARNMLFARAMSNGVRWYCPDIFAGPVYTPEELGTPVNGDGEPLVVQAEVETVEAPAEVQPEPPERPLGDNGGRPIEPPADKPKLTALQIRFFKRCGELKQEIGPPMYYRCLKEFDFAHCNDVEPDDSDTMRAVIESLESEAAVASDVESAELANAIDPQ